MNWRGAYASLTDVSRNFFVLDVPGPTAPLLGPLPFKRLPSQMCEHQYVPTLCAAYTARMTRAVVWA